MKQGTGKELVAHAIHNLSSRRKRQIHQDKCGSFPGKSLVESEFFGYEGRSLSQAPARKGRKGKFELADKGTLFIDEINQMPLSSAAETAESAPGNGIRAVSAAKRRCPVDVRSDRRVPMRIWSSW